MTPDPAGPIPTQTRALPLHDAIAAQARRLWERYGRPEGRDDEIWLEAERQVLGVDPRVTQIPGGAVAAHPLREAVNAPHPRSAPPQPPVPPAAQPDPAPTLNPRPSDEDERPRRPLERRPRPAKTTIR